MGADHVRKLAPLRVNAFARATLATFTACATAFCSLEKRIYIPLPTEVDRDALFRICMRGLDLADDVDIPSLAATTAGYSGADIANVCRDAAMMPIRKLMMDARKKGVSLEEMKKLLQQGDGADKIAAQPVRQADFQEALAKVSSSVGGADLKRYEEWMAQFGAT